MRLRVLIFTFALFVVQINSTNARGQASAQVRQFPLDDPMFGISYMRASVHYEPMPTKLLKLCPDLREGKYWTFAQHQSGASEYFVLLGVHNNQDGDSLGFAVKIEGSNCQESDSLWMLSGVPPKNGYSSETINSQLPGQGAKEICDHKPFGPCYYFLRSPEEEAILRGLIEDGLARAIRAYGGEAQFMKKACVSSLIEGNSSLLVQQELIKFCKK
jgi:hypothetical protein